MARTWTDEQKQKQREAIKRWQPWTKSTGPTTDIGKRTSAHNAYKHGRYDAGSMEDRRVLSQILRDTRALISFGRAWLRWQKQQDKIRKLQKELSTSSNPFLHPNPLPLGEGAKESFSPSSPLPPGEDLGEGILCTPHSQLPTFFPKSQNELLTAPIKPFLIRHSGGSRNLPIVTEKDSGFRRSDDGKEKLCVPLCALRLNHSSSPHPPHNMRLPSPSGGGLGRGCFFPKPRNELLTRPVSYPANILYFPMKRLPDPGKSDKNSSIFNRCEVLMNFQSLKNIDVKGKVVLLRADLNVPAENGVITDTTRIDRLKPTIDFLTQNGAKTLVISHFGRPKGVTPEFSLKFMLPALEKSWGVKVGFAADVIGAPAEAAKSALQNGQVTLLENVRFHPEEEKNDAAFTKQLAALGDIYCNDAFSAAHRAHASTEGLAHFLTPCAGFLMEAELNALTAALENPQRPVMAIVGGSKISTKLSVLNNLVRKVQYLYLGGGMANTFLFAQGVEVGKSLCERDMADEARKIMETAKSAGCEILMPVDRVIVDKFGENAPHEVVATGAMPADREAVDVGPATIAMMRDKLSGCKTVLWNGPLGVFEVKPFDTGTNNAAKAVAELTQAGKLVSVAGGGDTVSALEHAGCADKFTYVSSAGGAFLEWMEGKPLPGVEALSSPRKAA